MDLLHDRQAARSKVAVSAVRCRNEMVGGTEARTTERGMSGPVQGHGGEHVCGARESGTGEEVDRVLKRHRAGWNKPGTAGVTYGRGESKCLAGYHRTQVRLRGSQGHTNAREVPKREHGSPVEGVDGSVGTDNRRHV